MKNEIFQAKQEDQQQVESETVVIEEPLLNVVDNKKTIEKETSSSETEREYTPENNKSAGEQFESDVKSLFSTIGKAIGVSTE
mgnify:FL=1